MERKFVKSKKAQRATELRINASVSIQENRPAALRGSEIEPIDYESFIEKNISLLRGDHQKEVLTFPADDFAEDIVRRSGQTIVNPTRVSPSIRNSRDPFVKHCADFYASDYGLINYKNNASSGSVFTLPGFQDVVTIEEMSNGSISGNLPTQKFEFDEETDLIESEERGSLTKRGYLWKTPFNLKGEKQSLFTKSAFKRRLFSVHQLPDKTYTLNYSKDDRKDLKGSVHLGGCVAVIKQTSRAQNRRWCFELHMSSKHVLNLAAETQPEQEEWVAILQSAVNAASFSDGSSSIAPADELNYDSDVSDVVDSRPNHVPPACPPTSILGSEIQRYCKETDRTISESRKQDRQNLFSLYNNLQPSPMDLPECIDTVRGSLTAGPLPYKAPDCLRLLFSFQELNFRLKVAHEGTRLDNVEPFFATIALYDVEKERKLTEDISIDVNPGAVWKMVQDIPSEVNGAGDTNKGSDLPPYSTFHQTIQYLRQVVLPIKDPKRVDDLFIYVRIDKILQGSVYQSIDVYCKNTAGDHEKVVHKTLKQVQMFCSKFGSRFRTPFCWAAIRLAKCLPECTGSNSAAHSTQLFRIDQGKLTEESVIKNLVDYRG
jgi:hypothetical protein